MRESQDDERQVSVQRFGNLRQAVVIQVEFLKLLTAFDLRGNSFDEVMTS